MGDNPHFLVVWWQAFRYHFVPPSFLPAIVGGFIAWATTGNFKLYYFILTILGVTVNHIALNMTDDYFDYQHSVDRAKTREKNPYSGGSGTLTNGLIQPSHMVNAFRLGYVITITIGLFLVVMRGWPVLIFGVFGIWCAYFYTAPPIRYGYRGWGELSQLINFSITIGLGSFYVQAQHLSWEAFWALLPLGFMMFAMITINEIPDEQQDRAGGKRNLVVIFGPKTATWLYGISMGLAYLILFIMPLTRIVTYWVYISFITVPMFYKAFIILKKNYQNASNMAPANMLTIRIHNLTGILLGIAYLIHGISMKQRSAPMIIPVIILIMLYLPVALTIFFKVMSLKPGDKK